MRQAGTDKAVSLLCIESKKKIERRKNFMKRPTLHAVWLIPALLLAALLPGACTFGDGLDPCPYNVKLEYWYAGSGVENTLPVYVDNMRQYVFDGSGALFSVTTLRGDSVTGWQGNLPDGEYTFVLWGNAGDESKSAEVVENTGEDDKTNGKDHETNNNEPMNMETMTLTSRRDGIPPGYREDTDRLYYGTATLTVEGGMTQRRRVYLSHAHASLSVTVVWQTEEKPVEGLYRMRLKGVPAVYGFTGGTEQTTPSGDGTFTLPRVDRPVTYHETRAALNYENEVTGRFVTFRYTSVTHPIWSLWRDGEQVVKDLDLYLFFRKLPMDMNTNMEQEFDLLVTIYEDKITVTQATAADWDEGGAIG